MSRPTEPTDEMIQALCMLLMEGISMRQICRRDDMPRRSTVNYWLFAAGKYPDNPKYEQHRKFADQSVRAREIGMLELADEALEIAHDGSLDELEDGRIDHEHVNRSRLRIDTIRWYTKVFARKQFGDHIDVSSTDGTMSPRKGLNDFYADQAEAGSDTQSDT